MSAATVPGRRMNWKRLQPSSLRHAMELCKDHGKAKLNRSVEQIAEHMGVTDHWSLYKWFQNGRMPLNLVRPFEDACGIDFVSRWIAASAGKLLVDMPAGRPASNDSLVEMNTGFAEALQLLTDFYAPERGADPAQVLAALTTHLQQVAWHHANVTQHATPQLDFTS